MSDFGQTAFQLAGIAIGSFFGPVGAAIGSAIGGAVGQELFPSAPIRGPQLESVQVSGSTIGSPISQMDGVQRLAGQVIWLNEIREVADTKKSGGIAGIGGQKVTTYRYFADFAVAFCEGEIAGVRKIFFDNKLVYTKDPNQIEEEPDLPKGPDSALGQFYAALVASDSLDFDFYPGTEDQLPDELIESVVGVGNATAYRGLCYIVFKNVQITDIRRIPNVNAELVKKEAELEESDFTSYSPKALSSWVEGGVDPRQIGGAYRYGYVDPDNPGSVTWHDNLQSALNDAEADIGVAQTTLYGWSREVASLVSPYTAIDPAQSETLYLHYNSWAVTDESLRFVALNSEPGFVAQVCDVWAAEKDLGRFVLNQPIWWNERFVNEDAFTQSSQGKSAVYEWFRRPPTDDPPNPTIRVQQGVSGNYVSVNNCITGDIDDISINRIDDSIIAVQRVLACPPDPCAPGQEIGSDPVPLPDNPDYCVRPESGEILLSTSYAEVSGDFLQLQQYEVITGGSDPQVQVPLGPVINLDDPESAADNTEAFWVAAYEAARAATPDLIAADLVYGIDYPVSVTSACRLDQDFGLINAIPTTLAEVVSRICTRHGLAANEYDVTGLNEIEDGELTETPVLIDGYSIKNAISGREQLEQLRTFGYFDAVESDGVLKFVRRGLTAVATLDENELGPYIGTRGPAVQIERTQDIELPRQVRVHYSSPARDHQPSEQQSLQIPGTTNNGVDINLAIAMSDDKARQISEVVLFDAWTERNRYTTALSNRWLALEPTDCVIVPIEGQTERLRIIATDYSPQGVVSISAVRDDDAIYVSQAIGSGGTFTPQLPSPRGPTEAYYLDLPPLSQSHDDPGYYVAVRGLLTSWPGCAVLRSEDGGDTYGQLLITNEGATVASATAALPVGPSTIPDLGNTLTVQLLSGTLVSITNAALLAGGNLAALQSGSGWELLQFQTATETATAGVYELTGLLRGRRGTEYAIDGHAVGNKLVLLDALARLPLELSGVGQTLPHKAVTGGTSVDNTPAVDVTPSAEALRPWSPANLVALPNAAGDIVLTWQWRNRFGIGLRSGVTVPLSDVPEAGEVDIVVGGSVVRTIAVTAPTATYTTAQQAADSFTAGSARVVQINPLIGRGRAAEVTL